jgi:hypothetical protein
MRRLLALCLLAPALGLLASGCGSENDGDSPGSPADTAPADTGSGTTEDDEGDYGY